MSDAPHGAPEASVRTPSRFSLIWLVPIIAAAIAIYLGWQSLASRGPLITITFDNGAGLTAGETRVEHKAVALGTVEGVTLEDHFTKVVASVRMSKNAAPLLTTHARFWVVRPRFSLTNPSGLQTLVSGSYIAVDPGPPGGEETRQFVGLSQPPAIRSDEPGQTFTLQAPRLGWLETGAPVFYRDIVVGQLLDYEESGMTKPIIMHVFIKAPYDHYVRADTHFWNTSGLAMSFGPTGMHVAVESIQALLAGGIEFANFGDAAESPPAKPDRVFELYENYEDAQNAGFRDNIHYVSYFTESVAGLGPGSPVESYGIRIGTVTGTQFQLDPKTDEPRVRVTFDIQPERVYAPGQVPQEDPLRVTERMVRLGMRARVETANLLTGQEKITLDTVPNPPPAKVNTQGKLIVWPSVSGGGFQDLSNSLNQLVAKLNSVPLDRMGTNANDLLVSLRQLVANLNSDLGPLARKLPALSQELQTTLTHADRLLASMQEGYGANSQTQRDLQELTNEATEAVRSIRELANYLQRHPASVVWGR
jgi:paraquat-inducible protein B